MPDLFGIFSLVGAILALTWILPIFPFLYVVARWRGGADQPAGVGAHAAMVYFTTVGVLMALAGAANLTYGMVSVTDVDPEMTRVSWGLLSGALAFAVLNIVLVRSIGPLRDPMDVVRVFVGFVMVVTGMIAMGALILMTIEMFREAEGDRAIEARSDAIRMYGSWTLYFLTTYLLTTRLLSRHAITSNTAS